MQAAREAYRHALMVSRVVNGGEALSPTTADFVKLVNHTPRNKSELAQHYYK